MPHQSELFSFSIAPVTGRIVIGPIPPHVWHSGTSKEAAEAIAPHACILRERVFDAIQRAGSSGITDTEIQEALGMSGDTERPRRVELFKASRIYPEGQRRTASGRLADVWKSIEFYGRNQ